MEVEMREVLCHGRRLLVVVCVLLAWGSVCLDARAQSGLGVLAGIVLDPDGKPVANAPVIARSESKNVERTATTDANGRFSVESLPFGLYAIEVSAPNFALARRTGVQVGAEKTPDITFTLAVASLNEQVTVSGFTSEAGSGAPSQGSLTARSAQSQISGTFIDNYTSPIADYTQVMQMAPGTFSYSPNGQGLGDSKLFFRGFADGQYTMSFDGIPFNDTNTPTHHSWAFFPSQFTGGAVFDRSPGSAATIGPTNFGGSINLLSRAINSEPQLNGTVSYGSFNTRLFDAEFDSGRFGPDGRSRFLIEGHEMRSDGYQTYNRQRRDAFSGKYDYTISNNTSLTVFGSYLLLHTNTPNTKGPTRQQVADFGNNYLLSGDPTQANYFGYNFYRIPTDFEYVNLRSTFGHGWSVDDKVYTYSYYNKQNYNGTTITATSATDKLNSYRKYGNLLPVTQVSRLGVFRTGLWTEFADTDRYQIPSDPRTWVDAALPNFHEKFNTTTVQPYAEYEWAATQNLRITPGVKLAWYQQDFTQFADNGKTVGNLNGAASITHDVSYHTWLPSLDAHYLLQRNWSAYAQYATGSVIPPTNVFDVKDAKVSILPKPTETKTFQTGSVWKANHVTLDVDTYYIHFDNAYSSAFDQTTGETAFFSNGTSITKGVEAETNILVGSGLAIYVNGTAGSAKYSDTGLWIDSAPRDTETIGVNYHDDHWAVGLFTKRIGRMFNDNGGTHEAVHIDPFTVANLFVNYTLGNAAHFSRSKIRFSVNNLFDSHSLVAVTPASTKTAVPAPGDTLILLPARSVAVTFTVAFSPRATP
jgi:iron complex outermembrane receptor protein